MRIIFLDTETTGFPATKGHKVIEIGAVEMVDGCFTDNDYQTYINPQREIDPRAFMVHGISNDFLQKKPLFADVAAEFFTYIKGATLVMHNATFDLNFLNRELGQLKTTYLPINQVCTICDTLTLARQRHRGKKNTLDALCERYKVDNSRRREHHGALVDAKILAEVYLAMIRDQTNLVGTSPANKAKRNVEKALQHSPKPSSPTFVKVGEESRRKKLSSHKKDIIGLEGEQAPKLTVELVPVTCWYSNLRDTIPRQQWNSIKSIIYKQNNYHCEICGGSGEDYPVECYEKWYYDEVSKVQKLIGLYSLCPSCHDVKHIGLRHRGEATNQHIRRVNKWSEEQRKEHFNQAWDTWFERNQYEWKLDLTWLKRFGINVVSHREINNEICSVVSGIDTADTNTHIQTFPNMSAFGNYFYRDVKEKHSHNPFGDDFMVGSTMLLALNIANFHWVLVKINKERVGQIVHGIADYYDPIGEPMPKELTLILEDLLQARLTVTPVITNISLESQKDGSWLATYIKELVNLQLLLNPAQAEEPRQPRGKRRQTSSKKRQSQNSSGFFNRNGKPQRKTKTKQQPKLKPPIQKPMGKQPQQRLWRELKSLL